MPEAATASMTIPKHIFDLPPELRLHFYEQAMADFDIDDVAVKGDATFSLEHGQYHLPLLNACQTFCKEALRPWLTHLRTLRNEAEAKYEAACGRTTWYERHFNLPSDSKLRAEIRAEENVIYERLFKLEDIHLADYHTASCYCTDVLQRSEEEYDEQGCLELLNWLVEHPWSPAAEYD
ncbi:hypothetical protein CLAFUW4_13806 [Fulvia fulva]|uniref:Uncharacterized protein n=1 Tax=Passalora fulva TaxID=5499 RepID=A0A9Q8PLJ1_PASFU|nr:uncharacterized protein CLAFUR5_13651 [Fulvia fulva]KAK4610313.1 hypothetical protein CLAFUR4_13809 [Fulvia fulva]KAK4611304.1 hypothetical protein CLAFUR0_13813 [Fulvia fulva]UJO24750.1 hypothetical protein CLAFUR5_13651 [Fulvia fulva]WPV22113.1 hypothetical protein CLAFUW4_13806 [Fulvia fulva]WPV37003.1 hypothetical protein CLAFUW7_13814 [Fulvia fulva]